MRGEVWGGVGGAGGEGEGRGRGAEDEGRGVRRLLIRYRLEHDSLET